mgnify:CR=1 FL=1
MKSLIRLTAIPHPDINHGQSYPIYVDADHIVLIERSKTSQERYGWREQHTRMQIGFWEEVQRANGELRDLPNFAPDTSEDAEKSRRWMTRKDAAASLQAAYGLISDLHNQPIFYDPVEATAIQLSVPNARFTMLPVCYVVESPEEVAAIIKGTP